MSNIGNTGVSEKKIIQDDEIDLVELARVIWSKRVFILKVTGLFVLLGLVIAFTSPKEYEASCTLIPEAIGDDSKLSGSLGGLASLAGVDLGGSGSTQTINPALYQSVSQSTPFLLELMSQEYFFSEIESEVSIFDYCKNHYKVSLLSRIISIPGTLIGWIIGGAETEELTFQPDVSPLSLSRERQSIIENLQSRIYVEMDWDLNLVTVQVEMQDPVVAAKMAQFTQDYITKYVTNYSLAKSRQQLESIEKQYQERKGEFERVQFRLASFRDKNQNVTTARAKSEEDWLQSEYNLAFNVYNQLAQQREAIKLQIQEDTPIFTVLEPVQIPVRKSKPQRFFILLVCGFLGGLIGIVISLFKTLI